MSAPMNLKTLVTIATLSCGIAHAGVPGLEVQGPYASLKTNKDGSRESAVRTRQLFEKQFGGVSVLAIPDMRYIEKSEDIRAAGDGSRPAPSGWQQFIQEKPFQGIILTFLYELSNQFARNRSFQSAHGTGHA